MTTETHKTIKGHFRLSRVITRLYIIILDGSSTKTIAFSSNTQWIYLERCVPKVSKYNLKTKCDKSFIEATNLNTFNIR